MGLGGSKLQDELDASKRDLTAARVRLQALESQHGVLQTEAQQTAERLRQREAELAAEGQECERLLRAKDDELGKAIKQRQLAEELRRNDALLAKRVMCAQMKAGGARSPASADFDAGSVPSSNHATTPRGWGAIPHGAKVHGILSPLRSIVSRGNQHD